MRAVFEVCGNTVVSGGVACWLFYDFGCLSLLLPLVILATGGVVVFSVVLWGLFAVVLVWIVCWACVGLLGLYCMC